MATKKTKRKLAHSRLPRQRQLNLEHEGLCFDLREIFDRLNSRYFRRRLRGYKVVWGQRRKRRPKEYFVFGTIQEEDRVIRIHPLLDQEFVPPWFIDDVLDQYMFRSCVPDAFEPRDRAAVRAAGF